MIDVVYNYWKRLSKYSQGTMIQSVEYTGSIQTSSQNNDHRNKYFVGET